jgi:hypothetical protein
MQRRTKWIIGASLAVGMIGSGIGIAVASSTGDDDQPLTGPALGKATAAAIEHVGGGTVIEAEAGDDGAAYGVEIRLGDGSVVKVSLDENFGVVASAPDDDGSGDQTEGGDG